MSRGVLCGVGLGRLRMCCRVWVYWCCHFQLRGRRRSIFCEWLTRRPAMLMYRCRRVVVVVSCWGGCVLPMRAHHLVRL